MAAQLKGKKAATRQARKILLRQIDKASAPLKAKQAADSKQGRLLNLNPWVSALRAVLLSLRPLALGSALERNDPTPGRTRESTPTHARMPRCTHEAAA